MSTYILIASMIAVLWLGALFPGLLKFIQSGFKNDPAQNAWSSRALQEEQSGESARIRSRNRKLMEDVREKMERNR